MFNRRLIVLAGKELAPSEPRTVSTTCLQAGVNKVSAIVYGCKFSCLIGGCLFFFRNTYCHGHEHSLFLVLFQDREEYFVDKYRYILLGLVILLDFSPQIIHSETGHVLSVNQDKYCNMYIFT